MSFYVVSRKKAKQKIFWKGKIHMQIDGTFQWDRARSLDTTLELQWRLNLFLRIHKRHQDIITDSLLLFEQAPPFFFISLYWMVTSNIIHHTPQAKLPVTKGERKMKEAGHQTIVQTCKSNLVDDTNHENIGIPPRFVQIKRKSAVTYLKKKKAKRKTKQTIANACLKS